MSAAVKRRLSFANVMALIALFVALGGTVYATNKISGKTIKKGSEPGNRLKKDSVTGKQVKELTLGTVPSATNAANAAALGGKSPNQVDMWALVHGDGTIARSSGGVSSLMLSGTGSYKLTFPINVSQCAYNATAGSTSKADDPSGLSSSYVMVEAAASDPNAIVYKTVDSTGAGTIEPAFVTVHC